VDAGLLHDTDGVASQAARITPGARALGAFLGISIEGGRAADGSRFRLAFLSSRVAPRHLNGRTLTGRQSLRY
jgi:hypothetical protein